MDDEETDDFANNMVVGFVEDMLDDNDLPLPRHGGSFQPGRHTNIERDRQEMNKKMMRDYFFDNLVYGPCLFHWRYRTRR